MSYEAEVRAQHKSKKKKEEQIETYMRNGASHYQAELALKEYNDVHRGYSDLMLNKPWKIAINFIGIPFFRSIIPIIIFNILSLLVSSVFSVFFDFKFNYLMDNYFLPISAIIMLVLMLYFFILSLRDYPGEKKYEKEYFRDLLERSNQLTEKYGGPDPLGRE